MLSLAVVFVEGLLDLEDDDKEENMKKPEMAKIVATPIGTAYFFTKPSIKAQLIPCFMMDSSILLLLVSDDGGAGAGDDDNDGDCDDASSNEWVALLV